MAAQSFLQKIRDHVKYSRTGFKHDFASTRASSYTLTSKPGTFDDFVRDEVDLLHADGHGDRVPEFEAKMRLLREEAMRQA